MELTRQITSCHLMITNLYEKLSYENISNKNYDKFLRNMELQELIRRFLMFINQFFTHTRDLHASSKISFHVIL